MTAREITNHNIKQCGYLVGKAIKGKGAEILSRPRYVCSKWESDDNNEKEISRLKKAIEKEGVDNIYFSEIRVNTPERTRSYHFGENYTHSLKKFSVKKAVKNNFKNIEYAAIYTIPKLLCYLPLSKVKSDLASQQELVRDVSRSAEGYNIIGGFQESSYDELDNLITFDSYRGKDNWGYNGDYTLYHGPSICLDNEELDCINGRISNYNESVIDDFWNFTMSDEDPFSWADPDNRVSVYARKGKDWYVTSGIEQEQIYLTYKNDDGELIDEEEFWYFFEYADDKLVEKVADLVRSMAREVEIDGLINNELKTGTWSYKEDYSNNIGIFNSKILENEYGDDSSDFREWIRDYVDWSAVGNPEDIVVQAYEKFLIAHMDKDNKLFGRYNHFNKLKKIVENEGKELVYTSVEGLSSDKRWAIRYKGEEYHFLLSSLFDETPNKFYKHISKQLTKRTIEKIEMKKVLDKAQEVFVGIEDSLNSGNCKFGTKSFCSKFGIDTNKIGGIRGDYLLKLDYSNYTRRAVMQAIHRKHKKNVAQNMQ